MTAVYDLKESPSPEAWLAMNEADRIAAVRDAHERAGAPMGQSPDTHATIHVTVENRLAERHAAMLRAYDRFRAASFARHATIHALASVVTRHMLTALDSSESFDQNAADHDYDMLDPETLRQPK